MAHVNITKDLTEVKSKVVFGLTKRQLIFFVLAALVAVPIYFLTRKSLGNDIALVLLITTALPFFFFALYEKNGQPPEKMLKNYIRVRFLTQQAHAHGPEGAPVEDDHRQDRAQLDNDIEHRPGRGVIAQQFAGEDKVAGR